MSASSSAGWRDLHHTRLATPAEALAAVRPGDTVAVASFSNTPYTLCRALAARRRELRGLRVEHMAALFPWAAEADGAFTVVTNYATAADRDALNGGRIPRPSVACQGGRASA